MCGGVHCGRPVRCEGRAGDFAAKRVAARACGDMGEKRSNRRVNLRAIVVSTGGGEGIDLCSVAYMKSVVLGSAFQDEAIWVVSVRDEDSVWLKNARRCLHFVREDDDVPVV